MKNLELQQALQKLPPTADVFIRTPEKDLPHQWQTVHGIEMSVPSTIPMNKPGLSWSEMLQDAIHVVIVCVDPMTKPEAK